MGAYDLGSLLVHIRADATQYNLSLNKAQKRMMAFSSTMTSIGTKMSMGLTLPLAAIGAASVKVAIDLEDSFTGVMKTVEATAEEFAQLKQEFRDMSRETPVALTQLHRIGEAAGQLGIETENIKEFTQVMAELGVTTNMSATDAATSLARMANITQMPQTEFRKLGSTVVDLGNNLATTEGEIVNMGLRLAGAGTSIGMAESEILALGGALSSVGIQAELGGTAMTKTMLTMKTAVIGGGKELKKFAAVAGMTSDEFATMFDDDPAEAIVRFTEGFDDLNKAGFDTSTMLKDLDLGGVRVVRMFESLGNAGSLLRDSIARGNRAWEENIALTKEAELRFATLKSQMQLAKNHLVLIGEEIGGRLTPAVVWLNEKLIDLWHWWERQSEGMKNWIVYIGVGVAALGPLLLIIGLVSKALVMMSVVLTAQATILTGTFIAAVALATSAVLDFWQVLDPDTERTGGIGTYLANEFEIVQVVATRFGAGLLMIWEDIQHGFKQAIGHIKIAWFGMQDAIISGAATMIDKIADMLQTLEDMINNLPDWLKPGGDVDFGTEKMHEFAATLDDNIKEKIFDEIDKLEAETEEYNNNLTAIHTAMDTRLEQITKEFEKTNDKIKGKDGPFSGVGKVVANPMMEAEASMGVANLPVGGDAAKDAQAQIDILNSLTKQKKASDELLQQKEFELGITGLLNEERERAVEMREFENALQEDYTEGTDEYNAKLAEYGVLLDDIGKKQRLGEWQQAWKLYGEQVMNVWKNINDVAIGALDTIGNGITELLTGGEFDFKAFGRQVIKELINILVKALLVYAVMMLFPGLIPIMAGMAPPIQAAQQGMATANMGMAMREGQQMGNTMSDSMGQSNSGATNDAPITYKYHEGGSVGEQEEENKKNFSFNPKENRWMGFTYSKKLLDHFHGGGGIGNTSLKSDERVIVAQTGEVVLSREDVAAAQRRGGSGDGGGGGESKPAPAPEITIVNVLDKSEMLSALGSTEGEQVIMNTIRRNPSSIKAMASS